MTLVSFGSQVFSQVTDQGRALTSCLSVKPGETVIAKANCVSRVSLSEDYLLN